MTLVPLHARPTVGVQGGEHVVGVGLEALLDRGGQHRDHGRRTSAPARQDSPGSRRQSHRTSTTLGGPLGDRPWTNRPGSIDTP